MQEVFIKNLQHASKCTGQHGSAIGSVRVIVYMSCGPRSFIQDSGHLVWNWDPESFLLFTFTTWCPNVPQLHPNCWLLCRDMQPTYLHVSLRENLVKSIAMGLWNVFFSKHYEVCCSWLGWCSRLWSNNGHKFWGQEQESTKAHKRESTKTTRKSREPSKENERKPKWADNRESKVM